MFCNGIGTKSLHCKIQNPLRVWANDDSDYEWILSMILSLDYIRLDEFTVSKGDRSIVARQTVVFTHVFFVHRSLAQGVARAAHGETKDPAQTAHPCKG